MTRHSRRVLFYALVAVFLVLGAGVVLYAQGWRFDLATRHFNKVGAIFVRSYPLDAAISLDSKSIQNQSGFLSRGTLITNLFPKIYRLTLSEPGYITWHENVSVSPSLVAEHKYAVLVPQTPTSTASATIALLSATQKNLATLNTSNTAAMMVANAITIKKNIVTIGSSTLPGVNKKIVLVRNGLLGILQNDGSLSLYEANGGRGLRPLASDVIDFSVTDDGSAIAALEHRSIEIFSLNNPDGYYRFNVPDMSGIKKLIWYKDRNHLFVVYAQSVAFLDFADAGLNNLITISPIIEGSSPLYDPQTNSLYPTISDANGHRKTVRFDFPQ